MKANDYKDQHCSNSCNDMEIEKCEVPVCPYKGDEVFDKYKNQASWFTDEEMADILTQFISRGKKIPFNLLYNVTCDFARSASDEAIGKTDVFADPMRYLPLAKLSGKGTIAYLSEVKDEMLGKLTSVIGQAWLRAFDLCALDDLAFFVMLHETLHRPMMPELYNGSRENRQDYFNSLVCFHVQAYAVQTVERFIHNEMKRSGKIQFFSSELSDVKLLSIKKVMLDCKGANHGKDIHFLAPISDDNWLYIFGRKYIYRPTNPRWLESEQSLMDTMSLICGKGKTLRPLVIKYFGVKNPPKVDGRRVPPELANAINRII